MAKMAAKCRRRENMAYPRKSDQPAAIIAAASIAANLQWQ